jgi:hypothetical protein
MVVRMVSLLEFYAAATRNSLTARPRRFRVVTVDGSTLEGVPTTGLTSDPLSGGPFMLHIEDGTKVRMQFDQLAKIDELG